MTGDEMKAIRERAGLSVNGLAALLYYGNEQDLRAMERGKKPISGPIRRCLEALDRGLLDPMLEELQ